MRAVKNNWLSAIAALTLVLGVIFAVDAFEKKAEVKLLSPQDLTIDVSSASNPNDPTQQMVSHLGIADPNCGTSNVTICGATFNLDLNDSEVQRLLQDIEDGNPVTVQDFKDAGYSPSYKWKP